MPFAVSSMFLDQEALSLVVLRQSPLILSNLAETTDRKGRYRSSDRPGGNRTVGAQPPASHQSPSPPPEHLAGSPCGCQDGGGGASPPSPRLPLGPSPLASTNSCPLLLRRPDPRRTSPRAVLYGQIRSLEGLLCHQREVCSGRRPPRRHGRRPSMPPRTPGATAAGGGAATAARGAKSGALEGGSGAPATGGPGSASPEPPACRGHAAATASSRGQAAGMPPDLLSPRGGGGLRGSGRACVGHAARPACGGTGGRGAASPGSGGVRAWRAASAAAPEACLGTATAVHCRTRAHGATLRRGGARLCALGGDAASVTAVLHLLLIARCFFGAWLSCWGSRELKAKAAPGILLVLTTAASEDVAHLL